MKTTYVLDANRRVIARHKGGHDQEWGDTLKRHYDSAIAAAEYPHFSAPCSVQLVDPDPFAGDDFAVFVGEALPS